MVSCGQCPAVLQHTTHDVWGENDQVLTSGSVYLSPRHFLLTLGTHYGPETFSIFQTGLLIQLRPCFQLSKPCQCFSLLTFSFSGALMCKHHCVLFLGGEGRKLGSLLLPPVSAEVQVLSVGMLGLLLRRQVHRSAVWGRPQSTGCPLSFLPLPSDSDFAFCSFPFQVASINWLSLWFPFPCAHFLERVFKASLPQCCHWWEW